MLFNYVELFNKFKEELYVLVEQKCPKMFPCKSTYNSFVPKSNYL